MVLHHDLAAIERAQQIAAEWLTGMGLELKPSKTRIGHTLLDHNGMAGFDFLGFHVRQYRVGKTHTARATNGTPLGFKTLIKPSKAAIQRQTLAITANIRRHKQAPQAALIDPLNPVIRGWAKYFSTVAAKKSLARQDQTVWLKLRRWAKRRHPQKSSHWVFSHYWHLETGHWDFSTKGGPRLLRHDRTPIRRHVKVEGTASPFDGRWLYWASRLGRHPEVSTRVATLLKRQQGQCPHCGLYFRDEDLPELDHIVPKHLGGIDAYFNWQLLHGHCHDQKTAADGSYRQRSSEVPMPRAK